MKGSLVNRNGHYSVVLEDKDSVTGERKRKWIAVKGNFREATRQMTEMVNSYNNGLFVKPSKTTVKDYLEAWLKDAAFPNMTPRNYEGYEFNIKKYIIPAIGQITITNLKPQQIQNLCAEHQALGHYRTSQYIYNTLNKSLNVAVKMGTLVRNPCNGVESPKVPKHEMQTMNENDIHIFLEYARKTPYYALFYTVLFTGLRRSELLGLKWSDVDLLLMQISVNRTMHLMKYGTYKGQVIFKQPKTATSRRMISLTPSNAIILREHREAQDKLRASLDLSPTIDDDLVFCQYDGKPYQPDSISHVWLKIARQTGLKGIRLHDARHTHASLMLKNGTHPKIVQERLGHASIKTTLDIYSHVAPGLQQAAASRFDDIVTGKVRDTKNQNSTIRR
jgi:integrase